MLELVLAQVAAPDPHAAWLQPSVLIGLVAAAAGAIGWMIRQDRRIERGRESVENLRGSLERYQTREQSAECRRHMEEVLRESPSKDSLASAFAQIRTIEERAAEDRQATAVALARIEATLQALLEKVDALGEPRPAARTRTSPGFDPSKRG